MLNVSFMPKHIVSQIQLDTFCRGFVCDDWRAASSSQYDNYLRRLVEYAKQCVIYAAHFISIDQLIYIFIRALDFVFFFS